jgi:hypothetical protein
MWVFGGLSISHRAALQDTLLLSYFEEGKGCSGQEGRFEWSLPEVEGTPPQPRWSHEAVLLPGKEEEGGDR